MKEMTVEELHARLKAARELRDSVEEDSCRHITLTVLLEMLHDKMGRLVMKNALDRMKECKQ